MSDDNERQEDATTADLSRPVATGDDSDYSLSVEETLARYEMAGLPRTPRSIQRYCTKGYLEARRVETEFGEKFLIKPESVDRHIAYIMEVRPVATGRDLPRQVATPSPHEIDGDTARLQPEVIEREQRPPTTTGDMSQPVAEAEARYVALLERENELLRGQVKVKDGQINDLSQMVQQSNALSAGVQKMLTPLLDSGSDGQPKERLHVYTPIDGIGDNGPVA